MRHAFFSVVLVMVAGTARAQQSEPARFAGHRLRRVSLA